MKRNHDEPAAGLNPTGANVAEQSLELFEFFVDGDSQRLEDARGRVCVAAAAGRGLLDDAGEFFCGVDRAGRTLLDDRVGDAVSVRTLRRSRERCR